MRLFTCKNTSLIFAKPQIDLLMKFCLTGFLIAVIFSCCGQIRPEGIYRLVTQNDKPLREGVMLKIYSGDHFMFAQYKQDGNLIMAGGGNFKIDEKGYTEVMDFFTIDPGQKGKPVTYTYSFENNKFIIEAPMHGSRIKEVWVKENMRE